MVYTPEGYIKQTLRVLSLDSSSIPRNVLLIPTFGNFTEINHHLLGIESHDFYTRLAQVVTRAEICGEVSDVCVAYVMGDINYYNRSIVFRRLDDCIYPPKDAIEINYL